MGVYVQFMILGVGAGVVFAALGLGLVLTHRASGVVNFAHGAIAMYSTYVFSSLHSDGLYPVPPLPNPLIVIELLGRLFGQEWDLWNFPTFITFSGPWPYWAALIGSLLTAGLIGFLLHFLVFRLLRYQPPLSRVVASVGLMLVLQAGIVVRFTSRARTVESVLPDSAVDILGGPVPIDRFILLAGMLVITAGLYVLYQRTRFGIRTRAAAENERHATILGISADSVAAVNWVIAALLAGLAGIMVAPITGLNPINYTLFIIPALAAALMARFSSFWVVVAAGLGIGIGQSLLQIMEVRLSWMPDLNLSQGLPLVVIVVAMVVRGQVLPSRGAVERGRLPLAYPMSFRPGLATFWMAVAAALVIWAPYNFRTGMINSLIGTLLALSLVVVAGFVGQISLAQLSLAGISAFMLSSLATDAGVPFPIAPILAALVATLFGLLVAIPALRVRGASLAIMTLAAGVAIEVFLFRSDGWFAGDIQREVDPPSLFGFGFGPNSPFWLGDGKVPSPAFGLFVLGTVAVMLAAVVRLRQSMLGEQMLAARANERAAAAAGVNVMGIKLTAFAISAFLAGVAGALTAYKFGIYSDDSFTIFASLSLFAFAYLGGITTITGAIYAGTLFSQGIGTIVFEEFFFELGRYEAYTVGILLVLTALVNPEGIDGFDRRMRALAKSRRSRKAAAT